MIILKLNNECIRDLMLEIESRQNILFENFSYEQLQKFDSFSKHEHDQFFYCLYRLREANYIDFNDQIINSKIHSIFVSNITWSGHQFLDNIRDDEVWRKTKKSASRFSSVSVSFLSTIASSVLSQMIKNNLGV
ncbi:DUF2513 domain-containing protein [Listeria monocytogenes]|uniref:DUF2513 domain-containing protein n=1 Tax=Listeria monocytogenes TaxID=1639 RepID=UPI001CB764A1